MIKWLGFMFLILAVMTIISCQNETIHSVPTAPNQTLGSPPGYYTFKAELQSEADAGRLTQQQVDNFVQAMLSAGYDAGIIPAENAEIVYDGASWELIVGKDVLVPYFGTDGVAPDSDSAGGETFQQCVDRCIDECMAGEDPDDPNYQIIRSLCERQCRIDCAARQNPKGFWKKEI